MMLAQRLYEGVEIGDEGPSVLSLICVPIRRAFPNDALTEVRDLIGERFGPQYMPATPNFYKGKKDAQDAHEAVRPTSVMRDAGRRWRSTWPKTS